MELSVSREGSGDTLVLLHGFTGNHTSWESFVPAFAEKFRVLCVELPGHGRTPCPRDPGDARLPEVADALARILEAEGTGRAHFVGYSMGGRALLHFAVRYPRRVASMAVLSASPGLESEVARRERRESDEALAQRLETEGLEAFVARWMTQPLFATLADADPVQLAAERARKLSGTAEGFAGALRAMGPGWQPDLWPSLATLPCPSLIVAGALDGRYLAMAERMVQELPRAQLAIVPAAGHSVLVEQPGRLKSLLCDWLREQAGGDE